MWVCTAQLEEGLSQLRTFLAGIDKHDRLLALDPASCGDATGLLTDLREHYKQSGRKAQFDYNTVIVSLYGYFERFIEDLLVEYVATVSSHCPTFSDLPPQIQKLHSPLSIQLAGRLSQQRFSSLSLADVIGRLNSCLSTPASYHLNEIAFAQHTANFRHSTIADSFRNCGIDDLALEIRQSKPFMDFATSEDPDRDLKTYLEGRDETIFFRIDDLANRRNDVAHGTPVEDLLSRDLLHEYINFIGAYAGAIAASAAYHALGYVLKIAIPLGEPIKIINHHIVCIDLPSGTVSLGDVLVAETNEKGRPHRAGPILELQRDKVPLTTVTGEVDLKIALRVSFEARSNHKFYVLPAKYIF